MSFRLFVYYCAIAGGWAALVGWGVGTALGGMAGLDSITQSDLIDLLLGTCLGTFVGMGVGMVDGLWSVSGRGGAAILGVSTRGLLAAGIGLVAGLVGTALGLVLVHILDALPTVIQSLGLVVGWGLLGLLIGTSVGVYDILAHMSSRGGGMGGAIRKLINGVIGGTLGGVVGGVLFVAAKMVLGALLSREGSDILSANAWGFVALGLCIGLLIGLAQVILKEAWIKVEAGFRPGRELLLNKDEFTIGRGEGCDIALFGDQGVEKLHARIIQDKKKNRYFVADAGTPGGTFVNDERITDQHPLKSEDAIRVGKSVFCFGERAKRK